MTSIPRTVSGEENVTFHWSSPWSPPPSPQDSFKEIQEKSGREIANLALNLYFKIRDAVRTTPNHHTTVYLNTVTGTTDEGFNICLSRKVMFVLKRDGEAYFVFFAEGDWEWEKRHVDLNDPKSIDEIVDVFRRKASEDKPSSQGQGNSVK